MNLLNHSKVFGGNSNIKLAKKICQHLNTKLGKARIESFSDGEMDIEILENVRGYDIFVIQSTSLPGAYNLMELLAIVDALRRASARRITAVMPYFGFARQDRRVYSARTPITAKIVAEMLTAVNVNRILTMDLHADQIQGFFQIPVDNIYSTTAMLEEIKNRSYKDTMVVSPDIGGVVRARAYTKYLGCDLAIIDKRRPKPNRAQVMHILGDVENCHCIVVDDIIDTAGTLCAASSFIKQNGAKSVSAYITHPVLSGNAVSNIQNSELDRVTVTNTIQLDDNILKGSKIKQIDISLMIAKSIYRVNSSEA